MLKPGKVLILSLLLFVTVSPGGLRSLADGLIIDHGCTDLAQIPGEWIEDVFVGARMHYGHTSHGSQLITGLLIIETADPFYSVAVGNPLPSESGAFRIKDVSRDPANYFLYVQNELDGNPEINLSMFGWCSELNWYSESELQGYLDAMSDLESANPDVTFIYMTGNAQANGSSGYNRYLRNNQIRSYCQQNNKVLFDFADLDCWYNGDYQTYSYNDVAVPIEHDHYSGDEAGHTTFESCENKGKAVWWMTARLMGWDSQRLSTGSVSPSESYYGTRFQFTVDYHDPGEIPPAAVFVNIDGIDFGLSLDAGSAFSGTYRYATRDIDTAMAHTYYFHAEDGQGGSHRFPATGSLSGPVNNPPELFISGPTEPGEWMTVDVWGAAGALWAVAASTESGPLYIPQADLTMDIGPGDLTVIKKIAKNPIQLDGYGYGSKDFPLPPGTPAGLKFIQGLTKMNAYWAKTNQASFYVGPVSGKKKDR